MGKATGVFLILAGIGTATLVLPAVDKDAEKQLADVVRIATGATRQSDQQAAVEAAHPPVQLRSTTTVGNTTAYVGGAVRPMLQPAPTIAPPPILGGTGQVSAVSWMACTVALVFDASRMPSEI